MQWGCSVRELLSRVTSAELTELMAFERLEPFGFEMENWRTGQICSTLANVRQGNKRQWYPRDFMPKVRREMSVEEMIRNMKMATGG